MTKKLLGATCEPVVEVTYVIWSPVELSRILRRGAVARNRRRRWQHGSSLIEAKTAVLFHLR